MWSGCKGSVVVTATGGTTIGGSVITSNGYQYKLDGGSAQGSNTFTNLSVGSHTVIIIDDNSCTYSVDFDIDQPVPLVLALASRTDVSCKGLTDGTAMVQAAGGTTKYSYSIVSQPSGGTAMIAENILTNMKSGNYIVRVTDSNKCYADLSITISESSCGPVAKMDFPTTFEDIQLNGNVLINDTDPNSLPLSVTQFVISGKTYDSGKTATIPGIGIIQVNADGTYKFTPELNFNGSVPVIGYTVSNGTKTDVSQLIITITPVNDLPSAIRDAFTIAEDNILTGNLGTNDTPSGDGGNIWSVDEAPAHGKVTVNVDGTFVYTPASNYNGPDSFAYKLCDTNGDCSVAVVKLDISPVNDPPAAIDDFSTMPENVPVTGNVLTNDSDPEGDLLTVVQFQVNGDSTPYGPYRTATIANVGTIKINENGDYTFTPVPNFNGAVPKVVYTISDGNGGSAKANLDITVTPVNSVPVAVNDRYSTAENVTYNGNISLNDTISGDGGNVWALVSNPKHGKAIVNFDGQFSYIPEINYAGLDSFVYKICDVDRDCSNAVVNLVITHVNDKPVAVDDYTMSPEDSPVIIHILNNDNFGGDGPSATVIAIVEKPTDGTATVNDNGTPNNPTDDYVEYTPNKDFNGADSFVYRICDSNGDCDDATSLILIKAVNDVPIAVSDNYPAGTEDTPINGNLSTNDTRSGDGGNIWSMVTSPSHGNVNLNPDGNFVYTSVANYNGPDSFTYKVCDLDGDCSMAIVNLTIIPVNDPPVAVDDHFTTPEDTPLSGNVLPNDIDYENDPTSVTQFIITGDPTVHKVGEKTSIPNEGEISLNADGKFTFVPASNFNGSVTPVLYSITDGKGGTASASLFITVLPLNDPPIALDDVYQAVENTPISGVLTANDSDPDGDAIKASPYAIVAPSHGFVFIKQDGTFTYKPLIDYIGTDQFVYEICDNGNPGKCTTATATITIVKNSDCEVFVPNSFSPNADGIHDTFKIQCMYNYDNPIIEIYNRWGNLVFVKDHYGNVNFWGNELDAWWDGRSNNKLDVSGDYLPVGTYYYILKLDSKNVHTGFIYLNK